jgi:hypothetical protein
MATETKMIIITSDEDLIQKLSIKKNPNTHIIDLDDQKQMTGMVNLALLTELSEIVRILNLHKNVLINMKYFFRILKSIMRVNEHWMHLLKIHQNQ